MECSLGHYIYGLPANHFRVEMLFGALNGGVGTGIGQMTAPF